MMREEISHLILDIGDAMKDFSRGRTPLADAEAAYARLAGEYGRLEAELRNDEATGLLEGILYQHNIRNFSHHSGIYLNRKDAVTPLVCCGDEAMASRVAAELRRHAADLASSEVRHLEPESTGGLSQALHAVRVASAGKDVIYFASLSSSPFFSDEAFAYTGAILGIMIEGNAAADQHYSYFAGIKNEADAFIRKNMDQSHDIMTNILIFRNIEKIFSHMGFNTILDVSDQIRQTLAESFPTGSLCVAPSFRMYLVFTRHLRKRGAELKSNRVEFIYRGITLPFQRLNMQLDVSSHRDSFWYDIFQFEDYVLTGDYY
jgi:hypothetical protein